jgi:hypothetical protein
MMLSGGMVVRSIRVPQGARATTKSDNKISANTMPASHRFAWRF